MPRMTVEEIQTRREERAANDKDFMFVRDRDERGPFIHVLSFASGTEHRIDEHGCTCGDYEFRCRLYGGLCKHLLAMESAEARGEVN